MIERYRVTVMVRNLNQGVEPTDVEYVPIGPDLLTPRAMRVWFEGSIHRRATEDRDEVYLGVLQGVAVLREGVASVYNLKIDCTDGYGQESELLIPITPRFLERLGITEVGYEVLARCSLTRWQDGHYVVEPGFNPSGNMPDDMPARILRAWDRDEPIPLHRPPRPALIDSDGVPWYPVQVVTEPARLLSRQKRARITPDFLQSVWAAYSAAQSAGEPTTRAVREWAELRTGRTPSKPTIFRWIKEARTLYGEDQAHAED